MGWFDSFVPEGDMPVSDDIFVEWFDFVEVGDGGVVCVV